MRAATAPAALDSPAWLITFADLAALMLSFFVMLFAMKSVETEAWHAVRESLSLELAPSEAARQTAAGADRNLERLRRP